MMYQAKHVATPKTRKRSSAKMVSIALAICILMVGVIGGTIAWLMDSTGTITNTFTYGDIKITLQETTGDRYKMTPGKTLAKDPKLTVKAESEDCWLFVKIEESSAEALADFIEYEVADGWTALDGVAGVYYREAAYAREDAVYSVLKDDQVRVKESVTKEMLANLTAGTYPTLSFTGYAVQRDTTLDAIDTAAEAWALINAQ